MSLPVIPPVTHINPLTTIRRERRLPLPGAVTVRVNEKVQASHVIAEAEPTPKHYFLDLPRSLGIPEQDAARYLLHQKGERVEAGDVIAGPVGLARRTVRAPGDGRIVALSRGRVLFEVRGEPIALRAGFPGVVVATDGSKVVTLETTGALLQGMWGNGLEGFGVMRVVGEDPGSRLQTGQLDINLRGAILVAGTCDHPAPLQQAIELSVRGVILGGMASKLIPGARKLPYPVIVLEGFGERRISSPAYNLLATNVGREVSIDARPMRPYQRQRPEVIIPLPANRPVDLPDEVIQLSEGVRVRVVRRPHQGRVGVVRKVQARGVIFNSGVRASSVLVELEDGVDVTVPLANIEVLQ
jgi:hypothetical protein